MPTRTTNMRIEAEIFESAREKMGLPASAPLSHVVRAALQRIGGLVNATGEPVNPVGRPRKTRT